VSDDINIFILHYRANIERLKYLIAALEGQNISQWEIIRRYDKEDISSDIEKYFDWDDSLIQERIKPIKRLMMRNILILSNRLALENDKTSQTLRSIDSFVESNLNSFFPSVNKTNIANISLGMKHREAWRIAASRPNSITLVMEDDAVLPVTFRRNLDNLLREAPTDFDYIDLAGGSGLKPRGIYQQVGTNLYEISPPSTRTTCMYLISHKFVSVLDAIQDRPIFPIDVDMSIMFTQLQPRVYWCDPEIAIHGSESGHYVSSIR